MLSSMVILFYLPHRYLCKRSEADETLHQVGLLNSLFITLFHNQEATLHVLPEGLASMTYRDIGALPGSPLVQCIVRAEP